MRTHRNKMDSLETKIVKAMERIESLFYETERKCYLSFSGGKDSTVIIDLIKMCEEIYTLPPNAIPAVFSKTGIELGATVDFVKWVSENYYGNVQMIQPEKTFSWIINNKGKPMKSKMKSEYIGRYQRKPDGTAKSFLIDRDNRYQKTRLANKDMHMIHCNFDIKISNQCCKYLKKDPFNKYGEEQQMKGYMTGERVAEGGARELNTKKRIDNGGSICTRTKGNMIVKLPIVDWTNEDIEEFIQKYDVPLSKAYTEQGYERTGCFLCPFSLQLDDNLKKLYEYEPNRYRAALFWLKDVYIAQNVKLPFDEAYEAERRKKWRECYEKMRYEMLKEYRPEAAEKYNDIQMDIFDYLGGQNETKDETG